MQGHIIHLPTATEREPLITALRDTLGWDLAIHPASDGSAWFHDPSVAKAHPWTRKPISQGNIGCTQSHLQILEHASPDSGIAAIFEDDCVLQASREEIAAFVECAPANWDILLLGATEYVESRPATAGTRRCAPPTYRHVNRFWGTHALLVKPTAAAAALRAFAETQREGVFVPADWLYNEAIKRGKLVCYGPLTPTQFCCQAPGFISAITGKARPAAVPASA